MATVNQLPIELALDTKEMQQWHILPVSKMPDVKSKLLAYRLNCFGSLFFLGKIVLRRRRLTDTLHYEMCRQVERDYIKDVIEYPRDHFKSTVYAEIYPIWRSLPFEDSDAQIMESLGYSPEYIRWQRRIHQQDARNLIVSSIIDNAIKLGIRISSHYEKNDLFQNVFPEIMPDSSCIWHSKSITHKRTKASPDGEGTYDFIGSGGELQSRHYNGVVVQDDLVGRKAVDSEPVMTGIIDYHQKLPGAFDSIPGDPDHSTDELVVGNRWAFRDLNSYIKANEPFFRFQTHSAIGGCCPKHPAGQYIFKEEFSQRKLDEFKIRFGNYAYSCQYLNNPLPEGETEFLTSWIRYYTLQPRNNSPECINSLNIDDMVLRHDVKDGEVIPDARWEKLQLRLIVDPNHAGNSGRSRHAITVLAYRTNPQRLYLLHSWAKSCGYHEFIDEIYKAAATYHLREMWLETVAAQKYLKLYLDYKSSVTGINLRVNELKVDYSPNAKDNRIRAMNFIYAEGQFWCRRTVHQDFLLEYESFPYGLTKDILDTVAYVPQTLKRGMSEKDIYTFMQNQQSRMGTSSHGMTTGASDGRSRITGY